MTVLLIEMGEPADVGTADASELARGLRDAGADVRDDDVNADSLAATIALITFSLAAATFLADYIKRAFGTGVSIDARHTPPRVVRNAELPRGTILLIHPDGTTELKENISESVLADLLKSIVDKSAKGALS